MATRGGAGARRDRQPGLLAGRVRRRADRGQQPLRPLLPREAPLLHGGSRAVRHADPGGLHADDHVAALGRARHRPLSARRPTRCSPPTTAAGAASSCPGPTGSDLAPQDFGSFVGIGRVSGRSSAPRTPGRSSPAARSTAAATTACSGPTSCGAPARRTACRPSSCGARRETPDRPDLAAEWDGRHLVRPRPRRLVEPRGARTGVARPVP